MTLKKKHSDLLKIAAYKSALYNKDFSLNQAVNEAIDDYIKKYIDVITGL
jgi:hypothetical protein